MNSKDFRVPLLQSVALIILILLFIAFVISSGADDLKSGLQAVFSGISHSIVLSIGLFCSILLARLLLIALFLMATAVYSLDKAKETGTQIYVSTLHLFQTVRDTFAHSLRQQTEDTCQEGKIRHMEMTISQLSNENRLLKEQIAHLTRHTTEPSQAVAPCSTDQSSSNPVSE